MKPKSTLNVALLKRIKKHILEEPKRFVMRTFVVRSLGEETFWDDSGAEVEFPKCNTAACIGGWAVLLSDGLDADTIEVRERAVTLLGLSRKRRTGWQLGDYVFEVGNWPDKFCDAYENAKTARGRANVAAKRIDHLIATGE